MDSEHNTNSCDVSDCKLCNTMGSSLEESSSQMAESMMDILSNNPGSYQHQDNKSNVSQNLNTSINKPPSTECNPPKDCQPHEEISNTLASSQKLSCQSSEVKSNVLQDQVKPICETQSSDNQGASLSESNDSPKRELRSSEKKTSQCKQPSETKGLQASETVSSVSQHLMTKRKQRSGSRCHLIQETQVQTKLGALCVYEDLGPSPQHLPGSYMNPIEILDSTSPQQSRNVQVMSRSFINQPHQSTAAQESFTPQRDCYGNEFAGNQIPTIGGYLRYTPRHSRTRDLHLPTYEQSIRSFNYMRSSHRQRFPQYKSGESSIQGSIPQRHRQPKSATKTTQVDSKEDSNIGEQHYPTNLSIKESKVNQDLCPQQPTESGVRLDEWYYQIPQVNRVSNSTVRHLPYSLPQQQYNQRPQAVQSAERVSSASQDINSQLDLKLKRSLFDRFLEMCINQIVPSGQDQAPPHYNLKDLQCPYPNRAEVMNILVYGPTNWTSRLIQTYSRGLQLSFATPYSLSLTRNVTRGGIVTSVSIYQVEDLLKSLRFMRSCCNSAKTTVMIVFTLSDQGIEEIVNIVRRRVSQTVPITFVGCRHNVAGNKVLRLMKTGYMLKSSYDLSAFLVCKADSEEEVDAVFHNAIDVAFLRTP